MHSDFASRVLSWFDRHGRNDPPWQCDNPHRFRVSEIMLLQTQVPTAIRICERVVAPILKAQSSAEYVAYAQ